MSAEKNSFPIQMEISHLIHGLNYRWERCMVGVQEKAGLDQEAIVNGRIIGYLHNADKDIYQKDLERVVGLTKSAVSTILTRLQAKGYIERQSVEGDARLKKIVLTPYGEEIRESLIKSLDEVDQNFVKGLTQKEQKELVRMLRVVYRNMKEMEAETKS